ATLRIAFRFASSRFDDEATRCQLSIFYVSLGLGIDRVLTWYGLGLIRGQRYGGASGVQFWRRLRHVAVFCVVLG
ncbi:MAG: hypothetical protein LBV47_03340, partial [Bacteroidales bacterium]|nr:hypothetical protein [Bacteroidales bacterium]